MSKKLSGWLTRNELRLWMYACPFISFGIAHSYAYADAFSVRQFNNFLEFYCPIVNLILPLVLPLRNQDNLNYIAPALLIESLILKFFSETAVHGKIQDSAWLVMTMAVVCCQMALICLPIAVKAGIAGIKDEFNRRKSHGAKYADERESDSN